MLSSRADSWDRARQAFADQFNPDGTYFVYRRSQKGEAIRVSAEERRQFIDEFDRNVRRATWMTIVGMTLVLGGIIGFSLLRGSELSQAAMFVGIGIVIIAYSAYFRWAWASPGRQLAGRTPIAGELAPDEVRRLQFQRTTYGQLAATAFGGLMMPFIGSSQQDVFLGWNRLWLVSGGALVLLAAVQAFRKWRFEQEGSYANTIPPRFTPDRTERAQGSAPAKDRLWPYVLGAVILLGLFIAYTSAGRQLAKQPSFGPILLVGFGCLSLFTVARGFSKGRIEPLARGFYNTYQRETEPKRFWASMAWNAVLGGACLWLAFVIGRDATAQSVRDRCYNQARKYQPQDVVRACNQLIAGKVSLGGWSRADMLVYRGIAYADLGRPEAAIADFGTAIKLQPNYPEAYYDRALAYEQTGNASAALQDYGRAIQQNPQAPNAYLYRGFIYLDMGRFDEAINDFTRAHDLNPKDIWPLANRGLAYAWQNDTAHAKQDFATVRAIDPANRVLLHGEGLMFMSEGDLQGAVDRFTTAITHNPSDTWALQKRADAYQQLGDFEQAQADREEVSQLSRSTRWQRAEK